MDLKRVGLKHTISAQGLSGEWFQIDAGGITAIRMLGSFIRIAKGSFFAYVPLENVTYLVPVVDDLFEPKHGGDYASPNVDEAGPAPDVASLPKAKAKKPPKDA